MKYLFKKYIGLKRKIRQIIIIKYYKYMKSRYGICTSSQSNKKEKIVVSLTSYAARFSTIHICIKSLLNQTLKPDRIILYLDDTIKDEEITKNILDLTKFGLEIIKRPENIKPHKKYYFAIKENPNDIIITVDDDMVYERNLIESLVKSYQKYPKCVSARRVHKLLFDDNNNVLKYKDWEWECQNILFPSKQLVATGVGGVLYPPHCMNSDLLDLNKIKNLCLNADDIWLKFMQIRNDTPVVWVKSKYSHPVLIEESQTITLNSSNVLLEQNDKYIKLISEFYNLDLFKNT